MSLRHLRERVALWFAPWLYVPHREAREEAFRDLAEVAYDARDAVWTSPRVLVKEALRRASWFDSLARLDRELGSVKVPPEAPEYEIQETTAEGLMSYFSGPPYVTCSEALSLARSFRLKPGHRVTVRNVRTGAKPFSRAE